MFVNLGAYFDHLFALVSLKSTRAVSPFEEVRNGWIESPSRVCLCNESVTGGQPSRKWYLIFGNELLFGAQVQIRTLGQAPLKRGGRSQDAPHNPCMHSRA